MEINEKRTEEARGDRAANTLPPSEIHPLERDRFETLAITVFLTHTVRSGMAKYVALVDIRTSVQNAQELASTWGDIRLEFEEFGVELDGSFAVLGEYDFLLIFEAPDRDTAFRAGIAVESYGMDMQTMEIIPMDDFAQLVED